MTKSVRRLFSQFHPEHYELHLTPDAEAMDFSGIVKIIGQKVGRPSQRLTFHQNDLNITSAKIIRHDKKGQQEIEIVRINKHKGYDEVRLHSQAMIYPGKYTVELSFNGTITRPMNGLYPCFFKDGDESKKLLATQFESHHAREVFPCIDEPEAKATFDLSLTTPSDLTVIANTPISQQTKQAKLVTTSFETTPKMSSYLLAFVIGDLEYLQATTKDGVVVRTYATPQNVELTKFALEVGVKCLEFYNDYFDIPYPLQKCDMIALPDFASGAMENWGCVTYREQCMLVDPKHTSLPTKQYVAMVVAHELAHQWFGNLVTMRWWTDLWLNEGFASWIEYLAVDKIFPEWDMWTQFSTDEQQTAMRLDALEHTHPIEVPVNHPDEIRSIFDTISYSKGASVIHMLNQYLGAKTFRDGLRHYLKQHAYANTDTIDLWKALAEVSKQPVEEFMHAWTSQSGFPVVTVNQSAKKLQLEQNRFYANPAQTKDQQVTWPIPTNAQLEPSLFDQKQQTWELNNASLPKINGGLSGFYRVAYQPEQLNQIFTQSKTLSPTDRLGILSDAFETAKAGYASTTTALQLLDNYKLEDNNAVWDVMAGGLNSIRGIMDDDQLREAMKPFVRQLIDAQYKRLGWTAKPNEPYFDSLLRMTILGQASVSDHPEVVKKCLDMFAKMVQSEDIAPDQRGLVYTTNARHGDQKTFDKLLKLHNSTDLSEERTTLAAALTGFKQPELIKRSLDLITTDAVRLQDVGYWVAYSFMNRHAKHLTWQWMTKHWEWLEKSIGSDLSFPRMPVYAARCFSDESFLKEFEDFFKPRISPALERAYNQAIETIQWQSAWKRRDLLAIQKFFTKR